VAMRVVRLDELDSPLEHLFNYKMHVMVKFDAFYVARITPHHSRNISDDSYLKCYMYVTSLIFLIHKTCRFPSKPFHHFPVCMATTCSSLPFCFTAP